MFGRKLAYEVVPESEYANYSERGNGALLGISIATTASLSTYAVTRIINSTAVPVVPVEVAAEPINVLANAPLMTPVSGLDPGGGLAADAVVQTGAVSGFAMDKLANILDPLFDVIMAVSFPIAGVIMLGGCFFFMLGNSEKAWTTIFNAALGYVLIQMSPLFLDILREVGTAM